jgi:hypothetical protein
VVNRAHAPSEAVRPMPSTRRLAGKFDEARCVGEPGNLVRRVTQNAVNSTNRWNPGALQSAIRSENLFQFSYVKRLRRPPMQHGMAVGANGKQVLPGIYFVVFSNL